MIADVAALEEIGIEQALDHAVGLAMAVGETDQPVRVDGVRRATDVVEGEGDLFLPSGLANPVVDLLGVLRAAEFELEVGLALQGLPPACPD